MRRLICAFVVRIWHKQGFSWWCSIIYQPLRLYSLPPLQNQNQNCYWWHVQMTIIHQDLWWGKLVPSPYKRSELSNRVFCSFSSRKESICTSRYTPLKLTEIIPSHTHVSEWAFDLVFTGLTHTRVILRNWVNVEWSLHLPRAPLTCSDFLFVQSFALQNVLFEKARWGREYFQRQT